MKPLFLFLSILAILPTSLTAQVNRSGTPIVTTVDALETPGDPLNLCITMDKRGVMFFGNQSKGVLTYDGLRWKLIPLNRPQRINALASDYRGVVYVGGTNDFGFLQPDIKGDLKYESFADRITDSLTRSDIRAVMSIATDSSKVYFADRSKLWIYDFLSDTLSLVNLNQELNLRSIVNVIVRDNRVLIADSRRGLFEYKEGRITPLPQGDMIRGVRFIALLPCGRDQILIVTRENGVYLYNYNSGEVNASFLSDLANTHLKEGLVSSAAIISGNRIAIGVEGGEGIYIFDFNGVLKQHILTGTARIPRSAVTSMYCDYATNSQLWFCTAGCINRAYISLPVSEFGFSAGIVSIPGDIKQFNGAAYCSCDSGIYRSFTDIEGHFRFSLLEVFDRKTLDLQKIRTADKEILIASTESGLFQVDTTGEVRIAFNNLYPTTIKVDRDNPSVIVAGSNRGIVSRLQYSGDRFIRINSTKINDIGGSVTTLEQSPEREWWVLTKNPSTLYRIQEST
ncbi:MAG: hypothetical protein MUP53_09240, partial [Bacteroidales bacterium]|nr:hypothetical protein [Bacteroidales bacterium]